MKNLSTYKENIFDKSSRHHNKLIRYRSYIKTNRWCTAADLHRINVMYKINTVYNPLRYKWQVVRNRGSRK